MTNAAGPFLFMSPEHCAELSRRAAESPDVREACALLSRPAELRYELDHNGETVVWRVSVTDTVRVSVGDDQTEVDIVLRGSYAKTVEAALAMQQGRPAEHDLTLIGDEQLLESVASAVAIGLVAGAVEVVYPQF